MGRLETNWDLEAEPPELGEFFQKKKKGILSIFLIHIFNLKSSY